MEENAPVDDATRSRGLLRVFLFLGIVFIIGLIGYPLSSGPTIWLAHQTHEVADLREPVETFYQPLLAITDAVGVALPMNQYLAMFEATAGLRCRHAVARLNQARKLINVGRLDSAERIAEVVKQCDCQFGLFDDRPEMVLMVISRERTNTSP